MGGDMNYNLDGSGVAIAFVSGTVLAFGAALLSIHPLVIPEELERDWKGRGEFILAKNSDMLASRALGRCGHRERQRAGRAAAGGVGGDALTVCSTMNLLMTCANVRPSKI
ncbi:hypothetical protein T492DRAFT_838953 [Pavlovales sp. CCMP2436]|nr:hypothetical protein T492DRAFT_838953 [Pavlovales sp. CCMP2436]